MIAAFLLYRNIQSVTRFSGLLWLGVMGTMLMVILTGLLHFHANLALDSLPARSIYQGDSLPGWEQRC